MTRTFERSHVDKVLFDGGITKGELIEYYERIAEVMLPHLEGRPLVMQRCPDGIDDGCFYQKQVGKHFPDWIERHTVALRKGGDQTLVVAANRETLPWLANQGVVTLHRWLSDRDALEHPDLLVIDLDPPGDDPDVVRDAARGVRDFLHELQLDPLLMTTGSSGYHLVVPLDGEADFDEVRDFASDAMDCLAERHPDQLTTEVRKDARGDRVFLDIARNAYGQTAVAPYSVRALPGAPVAAPLDWDELTDTDPRRWTVENLFRRLGQRDDPWADIGRRGVSVEAARERLAGLG